MDKLGIKSTLYDLLGYMAPGAFLFIWILHFHKPFEFTLTEAIGSNLPTLIICACVSYVLGHIIAAIGSYVFEGPISKATSKILYRSFIKWIYDIVICQSVAIESKRSIRNTIIYVQKNAPEAYETAFVFLAFYGMIRNILVVITFAVIDHALVLGGAISRVELCGIIGVVFFSYYHYRRFQRYFSQQINSAYFELKNPIH